MSPQLVIPLTGAAKSPLHLFSIDETPCVTVADDPLSPLLLCCCNTDVETAIPLSITTVTNFAVTNGSCSPQSIAAWIAKYNEAQQLATDATGVRLKYTFEVVNCTEVRDHQSAWRCKHNSTSQLVEWGVPLTRCRYIFADFLRDVMLIKMATAGHCCAHIFPVMC
jgi:hypothetical protein